MAAYGALQPVADDAANGRRCPSLCENAQEPTRRRIVFSIALFPNAAAAAPRAAPVPRWSAGLALVSALARRCQSVRSPMPGSECACAWRRLLPEVFIQAGFPGCGVRLFGHASGCHAVLPGRQQPRTGVNSQACEPKPAVDGGPTLKLAGLLVPRRQIIDNGTY